MKQVYLLTAPNGKIRELDEDSLETEKQRSLEYAGKSLEKLGYKIEGPMLSKDDSIALLASWQEFVPDDATRLAISALIEFKKSGDADIIASHQKNLASLLQFIKSCEGFVKEIKPELTKILCDCADLVSESFSFAPGIKYEKCTDFEEFKRMCLENSISMEDACKAIFSSITMKKAAELLELSAAQLRKRYAFSIKQYQDRIKIL